MIELLSTIYKASVKKYTILVVIFSLFLGISNLLAQTFTSVVNQRVNNHATFNYTYNGNGAVITNPLVFFMTLSYGTPTSINGDLIHAGDEFPLFSDNKSPNFLITTPFNFFDGKLEGGKWQFHLNTESPITIYNWGIIEQVPEPSTISMICIGGVMFYLITLLKNDETTKSY